MSPDVRHPRVQAKRLRHEHAAFFIERETNRIGQKRFGRPLLQLDPRRHLNGLHRLDAFTAGFGDPGFVGIPVPGNNHLRDEERHQKVIAAWL